ncbi:endonuclease/exonuclease/phosphatase family protein [Iamia sp.]|uniref:endonuclease/exonuclease/phosphatase family protein n=1 Tax=Iamia sp. TaxID=2722710 RepID=UPI002B94781F|nr:endonuclease/exonuclease/phosphatase family protein [Iamia sp.]HXH58060.1 endonuclease/exonuclease/phosphatase family protein [Iamia sp.]
MSGREGPDRLQAGGDTGSAETPGATEGVRPAGPQGRVALEVRKRFIMGLAALPLLPRDPGPPPSALGAPGATLTLLAANVECTMADADAQVAALLDADADLVCIIEHTTATADALARSAFGELYPHVSEDVDEGWFGSLVAARHPIVDRRLLDLGGRPGHVVDIDVDGIDIRVVPVHAQAPIEVGDVSLWHTTIAAAAAIAEGCDRPLILAGDWNATGGHGHYRRALAHHDLVDAQARVGRRWFPTWPVDHPIAGIRFPPFLPLDHIVTSRDVLTEALERIRVPGTDHMALRATLRLPA